MALSTEQVAQIAAIITEVMSSREDSMIAPPKRSRTLEAKLFSNCKEFDESYKTQTWKNFRFQFVTAIKTRHPQLGQILDWIERQNLDYSQCWVSGFSFGSLICMQLIMRRPEVNNFIAVSPQPNVYDFSFLAPCPTSGQVVYSDNDELVTKESIIELDNRVKNQKGVEVIFSKIKNSNHFFKDKEKELAAEIEKYLKEKTALI